MSSRDTRFLLVRSGQTPWNREVQFRGRADPGLDDVGEEGNTTIIVLNDTCHLLSMKE